MWEVRLQLALGAALGLDYLHTHLSPPVVHGALNSANILVTEGWEARVCAPAIPGLDSSRNARGTRGTPTPASPWVRGTPLQGLTSTGWG